MSKRIHSKFNWPPILPNEVAINETATNGKIYTDEELCESCGITIEHYNIIKNTVAFRAAVREAISELKNTNGVVQRKSEVQYEYWLDTYIPKLMNDPDASDADKLKAMAMLKESAAISERNKLQVVKEEAKMLAATTSSKVPSINIILSGNPEKVEASVVDGEVETTYLSH